jgi:hypothetical protein
MLTVQQTEDCSLLKNVLTLVILNWVIFTNKFGLKEGKLSGFEGKSPTV